VLRYLRQGFKEGQIRQKLGDVVASCGFLASLLDSLVVNARNFYTQGRKNSFFGDNLSRKDVVSGVEQLSEKLQ
jgi:hypothetical protein